MKKYLLSLFLFLPIFCTAKDTVDLVIFSFDRPLQLYALLESIEKYFTGLGTKSIIYRASNADFASGYQIVQNTFPDYQWLTQGLDPKKDFKPLTLQATFSTPSDYVMFAVDDIITTDYVNLHECTRLLEEHQAYGFYLRLGKNITWSYIHHKNISLPPLTQVSPGILQWNFSRGKMGWGYRNTVDMTIYKKETIKEKFYAMNYYNPNSLEGAWARGARRGTGKTGLCYTYSKMVNLPLNRVQNTCNNKNMHWHTPKELLNLFISGNRIDINSLHQFRNRTTHEPYTPDLINTHLGES